MSIARTAEDYHQQTKKQAQEIQDFGHGDNKNKQSRQDQPFSPQYALGSNHRN